MIECGKQKHKLLSVCAFWRFVCYVYALCTLHMDAYVAKMVKNEIQMQKSGTLKKQTFFLSEFSCTISTMQKSHAISAANPWTSFPYLWNMKYVVWLKVRTVRHTNTSNTNGTSINEDSKPCDGIGVALISSTWVQCTFPFRTRSFVTKTKIFYVKFREHEESHCRFTKQIRLLWQRMRHHNALYQFYVNRWHFSFYLQKHFYLFRVSHVCDVFLCITTSD